MCRVRPHVREPQRCEQRDVPRAGAGEPQQPQPAVPVHVPRRTRPAGPRRVAHLRSTGKTTRVRHLFTFFSHCKAKTAITFCDTYLFCINSGQSIRVKFVSPASPWYCDLFLCSLCRYNSRPNNFKRIR